MKRLQFNRSIDAEVLVVGGGGAAARAALSAKEAGANVRMAVKSKWLNSGSTATAFSEQLAIGAAIGHANEDDKPEIHYQDTMKAGDGFIDPNLVWTLAHEVPERLFDLIDIGLEFDKQDNGKLVQGMSDFATYPRTCRVNGVTARHILVALSKRIKELHVPVDEHLMIFEILTNEHNEVTGALGWDNESREIVFYRTPSIILACGGAHSIYKHGVGTSDMTGDGYAMAYKLGLPLINMEFVQIGPAALYPSVTLLSGSVWRTKPILTNGKDENLFEKVLPQHVSEDQVYAEKAFPFTISNESFYLDTSIQRESEANPTPGGGVWYQKRPGTDDLIKSKIPKTKQVLKSKGIDLDTDRFEVGLVSQCNNGGVQVINDQCETGILGLYAVGETAGGLRGPDRPGGNSLAEGQVFGHKAGISSVKYAQNKTSKSDPINQIMAKMDAYNLWLEKSSDGTKSLEEAIATLKKRMHKNCLVIRNQQGLSELWNYLYQLEQDLLNGSYYMDDHTLYRAIELSHMIISAKSIVLSALERKESRSCHYREDFPSRNDNQWKKSIRVRRNANDQMITEHYEWPTLVQ